jgi:hypothetical protein
MAAKLLLLIGRVEGSPISHDLGVDPTGRGSVLSFQGLWRL